MHYYVVTGGPLSPKAVGIIGDGKVIAADQGIDFCIENGINLSLAVGDMDSVSKSGLSLIKEKGIPIKKYPVEKDMTDTELAVSLVPEDNEITVVCPLNGRLDHVIANLHLAASLHSKGRTILLDDGITEVHFLSGRESVSINLDRWGSDSSVSLVPLSFNEAVEGVSTSGLYYPLSEASLKAGSTLSFSNRPIEGVSEISVAIKSGLIAIIISRT